MPLHRSRIIALDVRSLVFVAAVASVAIYRDEAGDLDVALVLAMLGFVQTVAAARLAKLRSPPPPVRMPGRNSRPFCPAASIDHRRSSLPDTVSQGHAARRRLRNVLLVGGALVALAFLFSTLTRPASLALLGKPAPNVRLPLVGGGTFDLADHAGSIVVLDFWATWCTPCRVTMPILDRVAEEYADRGVRLFFINQGESPELVNEFAAEAQLNAPIALDSDYTLGAAFAAQGLPFTAIVARDGTVVGIRVGASRTFEQELRADLDQALAK